MCPSSRVEGKACRSHHRHCHQTVGIGAVAEVGVGEDSHALTDTYHQWRWLDSDKTDTSQAETATSGEHNPTPPEGRKSEE
jgi:hypothetical protein